VGLQLRDNTVTIAAFDDALGAEARQAGLKIGDRILRVNGQTVHNAQQIRRLLDESGGTARLTLLRGTEEKFVERITVASATAAIVTARSSVALYAHHTVDGAFSSVGEIGRRCDRVAHGKESRPFCPFCLCDGIIGRYERFRGAAEAVKRQCHGGAANGNSKCE